MSDDMESSQKQKKRKKIKKTRKNKASDNERNSESQPEEEAIDTDNDDVVQTTTEVKIEPSPGKHKRHSRRKSSNKGGERNVYPHTIITAVLEELGDDDVVDELSRGDGAGENITIEPIAQTSVSLPTDKVYVERKNGFAVTPRAKLFNSGLAENGRHETFSKSLATPLELAIFIQKCFRPVYTLCHGLLGGMALLHLILVYGVGDYYNEEKNFVFMYTTYARVYQSLFHILSILCFISIMDRCDIKHMDVNQMVDLFRFHMSTLLVLTVYFVTVILTFVTTKWDDWLALSSYNDLKDYGMDTGKLSIWKNLNLCRSIGAISGWVLIALFPAEDMLHFHLCNMMKYQHISTHSIPTRY